MIIQEYESGCGVQEIANKNNCSSTIVLDFLHAHNIRVRPNKGNIHKKTIENNALLTLPVMDVINGILLGDGYLSKMGKLQLDNTSQEYILYTQNQLFNFGITSTISHRKSKKLNEKDMYTLYLPTIEKLKYIREEWYINGKKAKIPNNIDLNPITLFHWYIGDGSMATERKRITLAVNCFNDDSIDLLKNKLKQVNIDSRAGFYSKGWILSITGESCERFIQMLGDCTISDFSYKWSIYSFNK